MLLEQSINKLLSVQRTIAQHGFSIKVRDNFIYLHNKYGQVVQKSSSIEAIEAWAKGYIAAK